MSEITDVIDAQVAAYQARDVEGFQHISGVQFPAMPESMSALCVYQVTGGKIARLMLLF